MSYDEKNVWIYGVLVLALPTVYFTFMMGQLMRVPVDHIAYQVPLLLVIGTAIVLAIVMSILIGIFSPKGTRKSDARDREIRRRGEYVTGLVVGFAMLGPFSLTLAGAPHFWIAHAIYLAFVLGAVVGTTVKLVAYRRGL
ncbi:MAG: hypothetical protein EPN91_07885 [Salinibacterium sp.]|nr:MAG: hypothetical protein EPN91_07885 [Salinibacterium sp.]